MNKGEINCALLTLYKIYSRDLRLKKTRDDFAYDVQNFLDVFEKCTIDQLLTAIDQHTNEARSKDFFPTPAQLLFYIKNGDTSKKEALNAWSYLLDSIRLSIHCENAVAVHLCNTLNINNCTENNLDWRRKEFVELYNNYKPGDICLNNRQAWVISGAGDCAKQIQLENQKWLAKKHSGSENDQKVICA